MTEKTAVLKISHLSKSFGRHKVLRDLSLEAYAGEVLGFLGPNGAGKTTTLKIVAGLLTLEEGEISVFGHDLRRDFENAMAAVGGIVENPEFYTYLSGYDNLRQYAAMRGDVSRERIDEVVRLVGMEHRISDKVSKYSLGMRQRLGVAQAIMHRPKLLLLDEPTNGLDPASIKALRDILKRLAHEEGVAVIVSSHLMSEMEMMCDRVGVIIGGELHSVQSIEELVATASPEHMQYVLTVDDAVRALEVLSLLADVQGTVEEDGSLLLTIPTEGARDRLGEVNRALIAGGVTLYTVTHRENRRLEDVFIEMTGTGGGSVD